MKKTLVTLALTALFTSGLFGQDATQRTCGTADYVKNLTQTNPQFAANRQNINDFTNDWVANNANNKSGGVITIPVVVHVVWNTNAENISDAQVQSQIAVLNKDYRRLNTDASNTPAAWQGIAADCGIEFCLATVNPTGGATTGITRTQTNITTFTDDAIKFTSQGGENAWDRNKYLNIWVGDLGTGLLGYAIPPGGPANTDGVVIHYKYFGTTGTATAPFNKGRTATHEIGHWLNLEHIWGDDGSSCSGSDQVSDTPNQADENYGCPSFPLTDACSTTSPGVMFMNYMDYTDDGCMNLFTNGQKTRMLAALNGPRSALLSSTACGNIIVDPPTGECDTLSNISGADNLVVYLAVDNNNPAGYISGTNTYGDNAKVDKFTGVPSNTYITGGLFVFGRAYTTNSTRKVTAAAWNANGTGGAPGAELVSKDILINSITEGQLTVVNFNTQPLAPSTMYMGIRWTGLASTDSIALFTNSDGESTPNTAWERWSDDTWYAYDDADSWGLSVSHAIFPIVCPTSSYEENVWEGASVFPNPTDGNINVYLKLKSSDDVNIRVFNPMGQLITSQNSTNTMGGTYAFDLSNQSTGLYFVEVTAGTVSKTFKVIVAR
ncbi:MAG: M43 family zinc metalloprotease [Sphingobacteriales bacterium JAD_PAG50586_3]|nr:MAG: M43 family zinc metalloprotease [Sphingobacteriales bacterium JAD_PAG50586_3]